MVKKLTKKKALEIAESLYNNSIDEYVYMPVLCHLLHDSQLYDTWYYYWEHINTDDTLLMNYYFYPHLSCAEEDELLRLLTLHIFIEDIYG